MNQWNITSVKAAARRILRSYYTKCVTATFVTGLLLSTIFSYAMDGTNQLNEAVDVNAFYNVLTDASSLEDMYNNIVSTINSIGATVYSQMLSRLMLAMMLSSLVQMLFSIFVQAPFSIGNCRFFLDAHAVDPKYHTLLHGFSTNYLNVVKILFFRSMKVFLWSLLFIIPGVIKAYETFMVPYLLAENPDMTSAEVFSKSKEMMDGEKMNVFLLNLSFIGWILLSTFTFGIAHVIFVGPYMDAAHANAYIRIAVKNKESL